MQLETCSDEGQCMPTSCGSTKDCPGELVCNKAQGICVVCVGDEDCPDGTTCGADHECHEEYACSSDINCKQLGMVCDKQAGRCVECLDSAECPDGQYCLDDFCVATECEAGSGKCQDNAVVMCAGNGSGWETAAECGAAQYCEKAECKDFLCAPDDIWCDGEVYKVCSDDGKSVEHEEDCGASDEYCSVSGCLDTVCEPDSKFCVDNATKGVCNEDGMDFFSDPCPEQHFCEQGTCWAWVCIPGSFFCEDNKATVCTSSGSGVLNEMDCGQKVCIDGFCQDLMCAPNADYCADGDTIGHCTEDGMSLVPEDCPVNHSCKDAACHPWICTPGAPICEAQIATFCDSLGLAPLPNGQNCSALQKPCVDGVCVDCVPQCDGKECGDNGCGGSCGECPLPPGATCVIATECIQGSCAYEVQQYFCVVDDICVPSGTENPDNSCEKCQPNQSQNGWSPADNGISCGDSLTCHEGKCCNFDCDGKVCGDDGCGGVCGLCGPDELCCEGQCAQCCDGNSVDWDGCTDGLISEFAVTNQVGKDQVGPDLAVAPDGRILYVWTFGYNATNNPYRVYGRLFGGNGDALTNAFVVQSDLTKVARPPSVAHLDGVGFVVAWQQSPGGDPGSSIRFRMVSETGLLMGSETAVTGDWLGSRTATVALATGSFIVLWEETGPQSGYQDDYLAASAFTSAGQGIWGGANVSGYAGSMPAAAALPEVGFVAGWRQKSSGDVYWGIFDDSGSLVAPATKETAGQYIPDVASRGNNGAAILVADPGTTLFLYGSGGILEAQTAMPGEVNWPWESSLAVLADFGLVVALPGDPVRVQRVSANGTVQDEPIEVSLNGSGYNHTPRVAATPAGGFVVTWSRCQSQNSNCVIYAQRFDEGGNKLCH